MGPTNKELSIIMKLRDEVTNRINSVQGHLIKFGNNVRKNFLAISASAAGFFVSIKKLIEAAAEEEDAVKRLNNALEIQGKFTEQVSNKYQQLARDIQKTTRFADDEVMGLIQQLISLGNVGPREMDRAVKATIDFSSATGKDLNSAALIVSKAMNGMTGSLTKFGIEIDQNIPKTQKAEKALESLEKHFGGFAQKDIQSFSGQMVQLKNQWGDFVEEVGKFIIQSPKTNKAITSITELLGGWADKLNLVNKRMREGTEENLIARIEKTTEFIEKQQKLLSTNLFGDQQKQMETINRALEVRKGLFIQLSDIRKKQNTEHEEEADKEKELNDVLAIRENIINKINASRANLREMAIKSSEEEFLVEEARIKGLSDLVNEYMKIQMIAFSSIQQLSANFIGSFHGGMSSAISDMILGTKTAKEAFSALGQTMLKTIVDFVAQKVVAMAIEKAMGGAMAAFTATMASTLATAWAPAAALASLATLGGNSAPASAGIASTVALSHALALTGAKPMARGGDEIVRKPTLFMAGEAGPERATFQPLGGPFKGGGVGGDINISIGPVYMQPGSDVRQLALEMSDETRRNLRYYGK